MIFDFISDIRMWIRTLSPCYGFHIWNNWRVFVAVDSTTRYSLQEVHGFSAERTCIQCGKMQVKDMTDLLK